MREVFDNLRSTLSCSLCYESFKPNDVLTLECGHTMCREYVYRWFRFSSLSLSAHTVSDHTAVPCYVLISSQLSQVFEEVERHPHPSLQSRHHPRLSRVPPAGKTLREGEWAAAVGAS